LRLQSARIPVAVDDNSRAIQDGMHVVIGRCASHSRYTADAGEVRAFGLEAFGLCRRRDVSRSCAPCFAHGPADGRILGVIVEKDGAEAVRALRLESVTHVSDGFPERPLAPRAADFDPIVGHG
jgi:hypothetical protein